MNGSKLSKVPIYTNLITPCPAIGDITNIEVWRSAKNKQREQKLNKRRTIVNSMYKYILKIKGMKQVLFSETVCGCQG